MNPDSAAPTHSADSVSGGASSATTSTRAVALVTGASRGIGKAIAVTLANAGYTVIATARDASALAEVAAHSPAIVSWPLDVTATESLPAAVAEIEQLHGPIDVLVNNAGFGLRAAIEDANLAETRRLFEVNVFALLAMTQAVLPTMRRRRRGTIIMISSVVGRVANPFSGIYSASKFAVEGLSDALRAEVKPFGIRVAIVEPGPVRTEFAATAKALSGDTLQSADSPYRDVYVLYMQRSAKINATAVSAEAVAQVVLDAVQSRRPRPRYAVHWLAKWLPWLAKWLPTSWIDHILMKPYLPGYPPAPPSSSSP